MSIMSFKSKILYNKQPKKSWDNQDIADFYRAVDILKQAGLKTEIDSGVTDEGDPWFVFIRPENGDVIAHFAQIDGLFVAVSSLNQEVYKGKNIRVIVDEMLKSYPVLLPQSKQGGRLFLHPTAAITAFLAAAFILNIDGIKASSIGQIISAATPAIPTNGDIGPESVSVGHRSEVLKSMFSELSLSNYNVSILGVALIAHELSQAEAGLTKHPDLLENVVLASKESNELADESDSKLIITSERRTSVEKDEALVYSSENLSVGKGDKSEREDPAEDNLAVYNSEEQSNLDFMLKEPARESDAISINNYQMAWGGNKHSFTSNSKIVVDISKKDQTEFFEPISSVDFDAEINLVDLRFASIVESFQDGFQIGSDNFYSETLLRSNSLGVTFDGKGGLRLVPLELLNFDLDRGFAPVPVLKQAGPISDSVLSADLANVSFANSEDAVIEPKITVTPPPVNVMPILGHPLSVLGQSLHLGDAIDVVFYNGGDSEISGFELGKDLLWFFLSPEELSAARNTVSSNGDVILDFGSTGTLTFSGMLAETSLDMAI